MPAPWKKNYDHPRQHIKKQRQYFKVRLVTGRNINNLRYTDDATLMAESEEQLNSLLMKVKEELKSWLKTQHS